MMADKTEALDFLKGQINSGKARFPDKIVEHSIAVSDLATSIAEKIRSVNKHINVDLVSVGGILHDIGRRDDQTIKHGYRGYLILKEKGWSYEIANISANHVLIDRGLAEKLSEIPKRHYAPFTVEEVVVTYADKILNDSEEVGLDEHWSYLEKKYNGSKEGDGWYKEWKTFAEPESYELEQEVKGLLKKADTRNPPLIESLKLLGDSFSRIKDKTKREGITKHSLAVAGLSSLIAKNIEDLDETGLDTVTVGAVDHDVGRSFAGPSVEHPLVGGVMLLSRNYPKTVVNITMRHCISPPELAEKLNFPKPWDHYRPRSIYDKIVAYADKRFYLDQLMPDLKTRYSVWKNMYGKGENFKIWFPAMEKELKLIETGILAVSNKFEITSKTINDEIDTILDQYGITKDKAYQILNLNISDKDQVVKDYK